MQSFQQMSYRVADDLGLSDGEIPLTWWTLAPNFGDLLSPYLVKAITSKPVKLVKNKPVSKRRLELLGLRQSPFSYLCIGSIINRASSNSIVWGSGAFGTEGRRHLSRRAQYRAVRGPLTRNLLRIHGIDCPPVYGDPALLVPHVFLPAVPKTHKVGLVVRWSENEWHSLVADHDIKLINLGTADVERTLADILACEKILSSSLHGIIVADAYGLPSAWLESRTPKGLEFKFYDYFLSVNKVQRPQTFDFSARPLRLKDLEKQVGFDSRKIEFDQDGLLAACPFIKRT